MINKHNYIIIVFTFVVASCSTVPPPRPINTESSGIAIYLELEPPISVFNMTKKPNKVYFVRLDESKPKHALIKNNIIPSNYSKDGYVYLLNAEPGRYIVVAAFSFAVNTQQNTKTVFYTFLPADLVSLTTIETKAGELVFMGGFIVKESIGLKGSDDLQKHYFNLMFPNENIDTSSKLSSAVLSSLFKKQVYYKGALLESRQNMKEYSKFKSHIKNSFEKSTWLKFVQ